MKIRPSQDIKVYVKSPKYKSVSLAGSGNMVAETKITSTEKIKLSIAGSGDIKLQEVDAPQVDVNISGSGKAEGFVLGLESTKAIKSQVAESLYVAYDDAASQRATELA